LPILAVVVAVMIVDAVMVGVTIRAVVAAIIVLARADIRAVVCMTLGGMIIMVALMPEA
jgi:hypothetical protein